MIPQIQFAANLIAGVIGAYTDIKTGYIYDWITYPLMVVGLGITLYTQQWLGILFAIVIYAGGWLAYRSGKMGGGDIKLLAGIALVQPTFQGMIFPFAVLLIGALSACIVFCIYYVGSYLLSQPKINWKTERKRNTGIMGVLILVLLIMMTQQSVAVGLLFTLTTLALVMGLLFYAFEDEVKIHSFLKRIPLNELEDDEVLAIEHLSPEEREKWGKNIPSLVSRADIPALKHRGLTHISVYRNLPKFAPFLLMGIAITYLFPELVSQIVPSFL